RTRSSPEVTGSRRPSTRRSAKRERLIKTCYGRGKAPRGQSPPVATGGLSSSLLLEQLRHGLHDFIDRLVVEFAGAEGEVGHHLLLGEQDHRHVGFLVQLVRRRAVGVLERPD